MANNLLQLKIAEANGPVQREVIVAETMSMFNLHRALQFCIKPRQSDSTVDGKAYKFYDGSGKTLIKAPKTAQLYRNNVYDDADVGHRYTYEFEDGKKTKKFLLEIVDASCGDARYDVPRCISGKDGSNKIDVDPINSKLYVRRFSKAKAGQRKATRGFWCTADTTQEQLQGMQMRLMQRGLRD